MPKGSGGGGNGGRTGGGGSGDAGQPGEVVREANQQERYETGMKLLQSEIDKTNRAYNDASDRGDSAARKQLRTLRKELERKQAELKASTDFTKFKFKIPK